MIDWLATVALGPLLIGQGVYTRITTPKLPEPNGQRQGEIGEGPALRLLVLGDSAAAGVGVNCQSEALSGRLSTELSSDFLVTWKLMAQSGLDSREVFQKLQEMPVEKFDAVVVSVGVNDVTSKTGVQGWKDSMEELISCLTTRFGAELVVLSPVPPMHAFPALPQPLRWWLGKKAHRFNNVLSVIASEHERCLILPGEFPLEQELMASDGFHPGKQIYALWAKDAASAIKSRISNFRGSRQ
ncbi:MAG: SGNH/GDSL hydrolase family protein [Gammaproteobacteria bacterium]|nr:MAG: SGNH/GDSL hydrolase family protein [Gammaproteobacteria bacterium]